MILERTPRNFIVQLGRKLPRPFIDDDDDAGTMVKSQNGTVSMKGEVALSRYSEKSKLIKICLT